MSASPIERYRYAIVTQVRCLRQGRRWTQAQLARLLGVSQGWLSDIERGKGSLSAEQFLLILKTFNVTADNFSPAEEARGSQLQNALARLGARHLLESTDLLPSERLREAHVVIRETLVAVESPRHITGLAPVIVSQLQSVNIHKLRAEFSQLGFERRFGWLLENACQAIRREEREILPAEWRIRYRRALAAISAVLAPWKAAVVKQPAPEDILDREIASEETIEQLRSESSEIARRWKIISRIKLDDFVHALKSARENS